MKSAPLPLILTTAVALLVGGGTIGSHLSRAEKVPEGSFDSFGGHTAIKGEATGFFHLGEIDGRHYLITPEGHGYRALGINHFHMMTLQDHDEAIAMIRDWGFNAGCYQGPRWMWNRYPYTKGINLVPTSGWKPDSQFGFRDVFDPDFLTGLEESIRRIVEPQRENPNLIGYFWSDVGLWERDRNGESWISFFQSLPGESAGGRAWRKWKAENPDADENNFLAVIGRQLYSQAHAMIRKYDENHLIFGDRWHEIDMPDHVVRESLPFVDVIAIQPTSPEFNHAFFERIHEETGKPIYIADHVSSFATDEHPVTMGQKAKNADDYVAYYERYVTTALSRPYLIGFNKCQFQDQVGSGGMLKQGLLRLNARPYPTVEGVAAANRKALELAYADASGPQAATGESGNARSAGKPFEVTVDAVANGRFSVDPPVPEDGKVASGTVLTLQAEPGPGFGLDSLYSAVTGFRKWTVYREAMRSPWRVTVDQDMRIGASFLPQSEWKGHIVTHDVIYAQPGMKPLKYDVFSPDGAEKLPGIVIIHGGGWSSNDENVMRGLARELVRDGDYVVFSIDYRWIGKRDGDETPNTMVDLIEDVFGAIAHIQEHAAGYGLDPTRLAVTGDSAGGHLSAAAANMAGMIGDRGFGKIDGVFEYRPTYLPEGKTAIRVRKEISSAIQAAAPSYGIFGGKPLENHAQGLPKGAAVAISPIKAIPDAAERAVPQLLLRGTKDWIKHENVLAYADALEAAGQRVEYVQPEGAGHAFLDWKPDPKVQVTFRKYGVAGAATMKAFFDSVFEVETEDTTATQ